MKPKLLIALVLIVFSSPILAQQECILNYDTITTTSDLKLRLSNLKVINVDRWKKITKNQDIDTDFFGFGMDISGDSSYAKFQEERDKVFKRFKYKKNLDHATKYVSQTISGNAKEAYIACIQATSGSGIYLLPVKVTDSLANISIMVNTPDGVNSVRLELGGAIGLDDDDLGLIGNAISSLREDGTASFTLKRDKTKDISLVVNSVKYLLGTRGFPASDSLVIVEEPEIVPPIEKTYQQPNGVTKLTSKWWKTKLHNISDKSCGNGSGSQYSMYMWDGNSEIGYCQTIEKGDLYLVDLKVKHGRGSCNKLGFEYTPYVWDGKSKTQVCALKRTFDQLKVSGQNRYVARLGSAWQGPCPEPYVELARIPTNNLKFCAVLGYLSPE